MTHDPDKAPRRVPGGWTMPAPPERLERSPFDLTPQIKPAPPLRPEARPPQVSEHVLNDALSITPSDMHGALREAAKHHVQTFAPPVEQRLPRGWVEFRIGLEDSQQHVAVDVKQILMVRDGGRDTIVTVCLAPEFTWRVSEKYDEVLRMIVRAQKEGR